MKHVEYADVDLMDLIHFPGNARVHDKKRIQRSIAGLGQYKTIVVRRMPNGRLVILAGNGTADAMMARGLTTARVDVLECTDDEARAIVANDNDTSDAATNDPDLLIQLYAGVEDHSLLSIPEKDLTRLLGHEEMPDSGDAETGESGERWGVIIECKTEAEQVGWLKRLAGEGADVRAIVT